MHHFPFKGTKARDLWPGDIIQIPSRRDQNIRIIIERLSRSEVLYNNIPARLLANPVLVI